MGPDSHAALTGDSNEVRSSSSRLGARVDVGQAALVKQHGADAGCAGAQGLMGYLLHLPSRLLAPSLLAT